MAQELLDVTDVTAPAQQMDGDPVAQEVQKDVEAHAPAQHRPTTLVGTSS